MEDSLTGLATRRSLHLELDQLHQASTPLALIMIDLDLFKKSTTVSDTKPVICFCSPSPTSFVI